LEKVPKNVEENFAEEVMNQVKQIKEKRKHILDVGSLFFYCHLSFTSWDKNKIC